MVYTVAYMLVFSDVLRRLHVWRGGDIRDKPRVLKWESGWSVGRAIEPPQYRGLRVCPRKFFRPPDVNREGLKFYI